MRYALILAAIAAAAPAAAPAAEQLKSSGALFGVRENVANMDISPDGTKVAYIAPGPGRTSFGYVVDLADGKPKPIIRSDGNPERLRWCAFLTSDRLICRITAVIDRAGILVGFSRLFAIDADGGNIRQLGQRDTYEDTRLRQVDAQVLDWMPGSDGSVLMLRDRIKRAEMNVASLNSRNTDGIAVEMLDTRTLKTKVIEQPSRNASGYMTDGRGKVRMMWSVERRGETWQMGDTVTFYYRPTESRDWKTFEAYDTRNGEGMWPLAIDATLDAAYVLQKLRGRDALYRVKLDGSLAKELVYANDRVDVDDVVRSSRGDRVIGVTFAEERRRVIYFDKEYEALARALSKAVPNLPLIDFSGASLDGKKLLIHAGSDSDPGRYLLFDRTTRTLAEVAADRPDLASVKLANVKPVSYPAADGTMIPAYLTLPPGKEAKNLPAIVLPHGGPSARDEWGFDWLAQYLAHEGYAVLQPNYRGSAGYGDAWLRQNGFRSWKTSIGDVNDGARWLAKEGIANAGRLAVVGWSYGGYAALQSGVMEPGLFKGIVAIAPVTDLQLLKDDSRDFVNHRNVIEFIGTGPHVAEGSPLRNVQRISAPVLMVHGTRDNNVLVRHARQMDEALRGAGKKSELVIYEGLEHDLGDSNARAQMLDRIGAFLKQAVGP
jgi:dipeptidyl aminopeptidase/acylaminoacyl peptidase